MALRKICTRCKKIYPSKSKFCTKCGSRLQSYSDYDDRDCDCDCDDDDDCDDCDCDCDDDDDCDDCDCDDDDDDCDDCDCDDDDDDCDDCDCDDDDCDDCDCDDDDCDDCDCYDDDDDCDCDCDDCGNSEEEQHLSFDYIRITSLDYSRQLELMNDENYSFYDQSWARLELTFSTGFNPLMLKERYRNRKIPVYLVTSNEILHLKKGWDINFLSLNSLTYGIIERKYLVDNIDQWTFNNWVQKLSWFN